MIALSGNLVFKHIIQAFTHFGISVRVVVTAATVVSSS